MRPPRKILLVGEQSPDSRRAVLDPTVPNGAGARLAKILGLTVQTYLKTFDRENLLEVGPWSARRARVVAELLTHRRRVLLGRRVCDAHGVDFAPFTIVRGPGIPPRSRGWVAAILPHPSGKCRIWNDPRSRGRALRVLRLLQSCDLSDVRVP